MAKNKKPAYKWIKFKEFVPTEGNKGYKQGEILLFPTKKAEVFLKANQAEEVNNKTVEKERNHGGTEG